MRGRWCGGPRAHEKEIEGRVILLKKELLRSPAPSSSDEDPCPSCRSKLGCGDRPPTPFSALDDFVSPTNDMLGPRAAIAFAAADIPPAACPAALRAAWIAETFSLPSFTVWAPAYVPWLAAWARLTRSAVFSRPTMPAQF